MQRNWSIVWKRPYVENLPLTAWASSCTENFHFGPPWYTGCFCLIYFSSAYVIMTLDCSGGAQYKPPQGWKEMASTTLASRHIEGRKENEQWQRNWDRRGTWLLIGGLMLPGRSLVDSLHFLKPAASADPEYRCLAGCQAIRPHTNVWWSLGKKLVLPHEQLSN